jgi:conjugative transfer signal peptidase TraF
MAEAEGKALRRWGAELRRLRCRRREELNRFWVAATGSAAATALLLAAVGPCRPLFVWNASESSPRGLYLVDTRARPGPGDMVIAWAPPAARRLADRRGYVPAGVPLVKRVAAAQGDRVCADGRRVEVNGRESAELKAADGAGRPLPTWRGCTALGEGQVFLLSSSPSAFDGRYFGVTQADDVIGKARLLWRR